MSAALSLEQAPPFDVPLRFFLTAPVFGVAAGVVLAAEADVVLSTRWASATLAVVHLITLGFMLQTMAGALLQLMPVAAGASVWRPRAVAGVTHVGFGLGATFLVYGFLAGGGAAWVAAAALLGVSALLYGLVALSALLRSRAIGPTLPALRIAIVALLTTVTLGVALLGGLAWRWPVALFATTRVHASVGILGWALMLVIGTSYLVVPMFQLTPAYATRPAFALPRLLALALVGLAAAELLGVQALAIASACVAAGALLGFAAWTLRLQSKRRRKVPDTTAAYYRLAMGSAVVAALLAVAVELAPGSPRLEYLLGVSVLAGLFSSVITGMQLKILSFLTWLHASRAGGSAPNMKQVLPERWVARQRKLHVAALVALALGAAWTPFARLGGALFALSCLGLELLLLWAVRVYVRSAR